MANIEIDYEHLHKRVSVICKMLLPLRKEKRPVSCQINRQQYCGFKVVSAAEGQTQSSDYSQQYFRSFIDDIQCQYYEFWKPLNDQSKLILNRAYLNVLMVNKVTHKYDKLISIHCDPCEEGKETRCLCKRGPHFHVQKAENPIPKCHFPLNYSELNKILSSIDNVTEAMKNAVKILRDEILLRYQDTTS